MDITTIADMLASSYCEAYNIDDGTIPVTVDESNFVLCVAMIKTITTILQEEKQNEEIRLIKCTGSD